MSRTHQLERPAEPIAVTAQRTSVTSPAISGSIEHPTAAVTVRVNGVDYPATNNGDGTWTLSAGTIAPALAPGTYDVDASATIYGALVSDPTSSELVIITAVAYAASDAVTAYAASDGSTAYQIGG